MIGARKKVSADKIVFTADAQAQRSNGFTQMGKARRPA